MKTFLATIETPRTVDMLVVLAENAEAAEQKLLGSYTNRNALITRISSVYEIDDLAVVTRAFKK